MRLSEPIGTSGSGLQYDVGQQATSIDRCTPRGREGGQQPHSAHRSGTRLAGNSQARVRARARTLLVHGTPVIPRETPRYD